jgi:hypothetical protein
MFELFDAMTAIVQRTRLSFVEMVDGVHDPIFEALCVDTMEARHDDGW